MNVFKQFLNDYGASILYTIITALLGYIGLVVKGLLTRFANDKSKKDIVATCVRAVEQIFKDLHGEEKLNKAIEYVVYILDQKGIKASAEEIYMLIESAVKDMNIEDMLCTKAESEQSSTTLEVVEPQETELTPVIEDTDNTNEVQE